MAIDENFVEKADLINEIIALKRERTNLKTTINKLENEILEKNDRIEMLSGERDHLIEINRNLNHRIHSEGAIIERLKKEKAYFIIQNQTLEISSEQSSLLAESPESQTEKKCPYCGSTKIYLIIGDILNPKSLWGCTDCDKRFCKHQIGD